jgi:dihydroflavonol-4-reductase
MMTPIDKLGARQQETPVLVTGGAGYLAGWMIVGLLQQGYRIRTTLRDLQKQTAVRKSVEGLVQTSGNLSFVKADLIDDRGWQDAMTGCRYVMHVASSMAAAGSKGVDLLTSAREGTLRVLNAASAAGVERVVLTSSSYAVQNSAIWTSSKSLADEQTWTNLDQKGFSDYAGSKVLAERAAWDFIKMQEVSGMTLSTVVPGLILGPVMSGSRSGSLDVIYRIMSGKLPAVPNIGFNISEVRDLVDLHIRAMEKPDAANQRFIGMSDFLWLAEIAETLKKSFPDRARKISTRRLPDFAIRLAALFQGRSAVPQADAWKARRVQPQQSYKAAAMDASFSS